MVWLPHAPRLGTALALAGEGGGLVVDDARPRPSPQLRPRPRPRHGPRGWVARGLGGRVNAGLGRPAALLPVGVEGVEVGKIL